jgi:hypothetical protein
MASVTLQRMRELGFEGRFEVVYDNYAKEKMDIVLPGFDTGGPDEQEIPEAGARAIGFDRFRRESRSGNLPFAVIPAADSPPSPSRLGVSHALVVEPFLWSRPFLSGPGDQVIPSLRSSLTDIPAHYRLPDPGDPARFIQEQCSKSSRFRNKAPGLAALAAKMAGRDLLPVYDNPEKNAIKKLEALLGGLLRAQAKNPEAFRRGGIIVPVFWPMEDFQMRNLRLRMESDPAWGGRVRVRGISDPDLSGSLDSLSRGGVLVVPAGNIPRRVFEWFYTRASLPATGAGVNAQNLLGLVGKPFFYTLFEKSTWSESFSKKSSSLFETHRFNRLLERADADTREVFLQGQRAVAGADVSEEGRLAISDFILASLDPGSGLNGLFEKHRYSDPRLDRVLLALDAARRAMDGPPEVKSAGRIDAPASVPLEPKGAAPSSVSTLRQIVFALPLAAAAAVLFMGPSAGSVMTRALIVVLASVPMLLLAVPRVSGLIFP